ncbi:TBC1 domain family member 8B-like isoform X2 [Tripterygium wilfordii]|uniref:TBC1 domain family member 8B-like isoform X2 n=1 Tax=Tripterygium wilfordii TaxID=458696 RepID=A0A7J7CSV4_TRIWF|nr:TBC1 domain family member 8B-like isoform X2 [Tripterygium wilfordii]KAF5737124.1 TBC1 domain family member 8B-like isoform X2 [Tripterygium wilfordii]
MLLSLLSRRSLEVDSRDAYGFALRPQQIQRYREYSSIYKEEEEERSTKWKDFLEHQAKSVLFYSSAEKFSEVSQVKTTEEKEEAVLQRGREGDDSGCIISDCDVSTECNTEKEVQLSKGAKEEVQLSELPGKEVQLLERPVKEFQLANTHRKQVQLSQESEKSAQLSEESEKDKIHSKATKTHKIQTWAQVRPSVHIIENMMSCCVKKRQKMKEGQISASRDHLPSINEIGTSGGDSVEDVDHATVKKSEDNVVGKMVSSETLFSWKEELESLVHGGVPKDLRGEVWQAFVGVKARLVESYYQDLLAIESNVCESKERSNSFRVPGKFQKQIEKDIPRTFPGHPALDEDGRDSLRRLLIAYALHNPAVGYCQAMNFFAGILLLLMPEENAFWTLVGIMDDYFDGYYTEEMIESQVDQLVFEELMRERFPKLVNHLDYLGVQVAWISGPWFLSIFVNMLPWESVLRVWDVLLFEGNRVMLFRTALALMELYGPALLTTKDAGDAITLLQSLAGSTFDSSQLVFTACIGFFAVTEKRLEELREKHRPAVLVVVEERSKQGRVWKDSKGLASKLYSFKHDSGVEEVFNSVESDGVLADGDKSRPETRSSNLDELLSGLTVDSEVDSLPDLQEQVVWLKVEMSKLLEEKRSAVLRAEELETALMEIVKQDNRRELSARIEHLEQEVAELRQALADKREQEAAMLQVLMRVEQEQRITEDARLSAEKDAAAQRYAVHMLEEKYEKATAQLAQMEKRVVMAESMLEATLQYQSGQARVQSSPRSVRNQSSGVESPRRKTGLLAFGLGWRDKNKGKPSNAEDSGDKSVNDEKDSNIA